MQLVSSWLRGLGVGIVGVARVPARVQELERPPRNLLLASAACLIVSAALLLPRSATTSIAGYLLAPLIVTAAVSAYRFRDIRASQSPWYAASPKQRQLSTVILICSFLVGLGHAWLIATEIAKMLAS